MQFRWAAAIALWTMLSGPVIGPPASTTPRAHERSAPHAAPNPTGHGHDR
jgi:hypothetical protein